MQVCKASSDVPMLGTCCLNRLLTSNHPPPSRFHSPFSSRIQVTTLVISRHRRTGSVGFVHLRVRNIHLLQNCSLLSLVSTCHLLSSDVHLCVFTCHVHVPAEHRAVHIHEIAVQLVTTPPLNVHVNVERHGRRRGAHLVAYCGARGRVVQNCTDTPGEGNRWD